MSQFRITRCIVRGQFANAACFEKWLESQPSDAAHLVTIREEPGLPPGGPNDARYYLWVQEKPLDLSTLKCASVDLVNDGKTNWWYTQAEAQAVIDAKLKKAAAVDAQVKAANVKAVSPENIAKGVASDIAKDAGKALDVASPIIGLVAGGAALVAGAWVLWQLVKGR